MEPRLYLLLCRLQKLQIEMADILKTISDPPSGIEMEVLSDLRTEVEDISRNIAVFPKEDAIIAALQNSYKSDLLQLGFARIPGLMEIRKEIAIHHRLFFPSCIITPPTYPVYEICSWIMTDVDETAFETLDLTDPITLARFQRYDASGKDFLGRWLAKNFTTIAWTLQRSLCDIARRYHVPLLIPIEATPYSEVFSAPSHFNLALEVGVINRLTKSTLSNETCKLSQQENLQPEIIRRWVHEWRNWAEKLFPITEIKEQIPPNL